MLPLTRTLPRRGVTQCKSFARAATQQSRFFSLGGVPALTAVQGRCSYQPQALNRARVQPFHASVVRRDEAETTTPPTEPVATDIPEPSTPPADFAFALDIDGVVRHGSIVNRYALPAFGHLKKSNIPFLFLTNGGGYSETSRAQTLSSDLQVKCLNDLIVQSHTPFKKIAQEKILPPTIENPEPRPVKTVLVVGGVYDNCRKVAEEYGFENVVIPEDFLATWRMKHESKRRFKTNPPTDYWPFKRLDSRNSKLLPVDAETGEPLPIDAIFVFNDPTDWGLATQVILDLILPPPNGTEDASTLISSTTRSNPPQLFFSNTDLLWATRYPRPRLGQGAYRASLEGVYRRLVEAIYPGIDPQLKYTTIGKPSQQTYEWAEERLVEHVGQKNGAELKRVYMIGDNPRSDIQGALNFKSARNIEWIPILVESGVYKPGQALPEGVEPRKVAKDVLEAVQWALEQEGKELVPQSLILKAEEAWNAQREKEKKDLERAEEQSREAKLKATEEKLKADAEAEARENKVTAEEVKVAEISEGEAAPEEPEAAKAA
ncbi:HAD-like domain-containing protein [Kalaharituber pfeilii]|nr:HAD-like domain-containing protein [Kalaharituber pfeilii]